MTEKVEALRLADAIEAAVEVGRYSVGGIADCTAAELRRLVEMTDKPEALFFGEELARAWQTTAQRRLHELEKQRDELLEQLSEIVEMIDPGGHDVNFDNARAAIARAEGEEK